jgi:hypothetical protein
VVILDVLQVAGDLDALGEHILGSLKHLVADAILQTGQKKLMLYKLEGIVDTFCLNVSWGSSNGGSDSSHSSTLLVREALVAHLDAVHVVINCFFRFFI